MSSTPLFAQSDFSGGLDVQFDATKTPEFSYPLVINGRVRRGIIEPTYKHRELFAFSSEVQGVFAAGAYLVVFAGGIAYYANLSASPLNVLPITGWTTMATTGRIYAELANSTTNFFNRNGTADLSSRVFNGSVSGVPQALFCFDGANQPQAIFTNQNPRVLSTYAAWTKDVPEYVPIGILPCTQNNKLFLVSADRRKIYSSVSGRMSDFVINIDSDGEKNGDVETLAVAVSYHEITSIRPISSGQVFVTTLYASYVLDLNYNDPIFGEPNIVPGFAFGVGCVNDISAVDLLNGDTAFITQSGIQSFNAVAQVKKESNNIAFGAKIRGLLRNPQSDTCAIVHDDYAHFAVDTIFGRGVLIYDSTAQNFQSLDLSFGTVKQFANTRVDGDERLFFITDDNRLYEAYAETTKNPTRVYLGEWSAEHANQDVLIEMLDLVFTEVKSSGECKISIYGDRELKEDSVKSVAATAFSDNFPIQIPFTPKAQIVSVGHKLSNKIRAWKVGALIEWNFDGALSNISFDGAQRSSDNADLSVVSTVAAESFAFVADTGYGSELNDGAVFAVGGFKTVAVTAGQRYIYFANGDGALVNGKTRVTEGTFTAKSSIVSVGGTAGATPAFSLKLAENFLSMLDAIHEDTTISALIGGGDHSYDSGTALQVAMGFNPLILPFYACAGNRDYDTQSGKFFFNRLAKPRYYSQAFTHVEFFFYNGGWTTANVPVDANGVTTGATSEPSGNNTDSLQAAWLRAQIAQSTRKFKIIIVHEPPWTTDDTYYPGYADLRFLKDVGADAVISGHGHNMERRSVDGFPFFVCGTGGKSLRGFRDGTSGIAAFRDYENYGYLGIISDPLTAKLEFRDVNNNVLDSFALYAKS